MTGGSALLFWAPAGPATSIKGAATAAKNLRFIRFSLVWRVPPTMAARPCFD
jgi:hypothetical protein